LSVEGSSEMCLSSAMSTRLPWRSERFAPALKTPEAAGVHGVGGVERPQMAVYYLSRPAVRLPLNLGVGFQAASFVKRGSPLLNRIVASVHKHLQNDPGREAVCPRTASLPTSWRQGGGGAPVLRPTLAGGRRRLHRSAASTPLRPATMGGDREWCLRPGAPPPP